MNDAGQPKATPQTGFSAGTIESPAFLLCPPFSIETAMPGDLETAERSDPACKPDRRGKLVQFLALYQFLASDALVYLLPLPANAGLQDRTFTARLAFVPEHVLDRDVAVIAQTGAEPCAGEARYGGRFFRAMGYRTLIPPCRFDGEADMKHLHDNVYVAGYGAYSDRKVHDWLADTLDMAIIPVRGCAPNLLDRTVFPLTREDTVACTARLTRKEVTQLERATNIIDVPEAAACGGLCNSIRFHNMILNASNVHDLHAGAEDYRLEVAKNRLLEDICAERGFEPVLFNLSEFGKSGTLLSRMVLHLNRHSYGFRVV